MSTTAYTSPSPREIKKNGNHLQNESSVYLQQHAYNPVDWYPWGDEALERSKNEDKPIFLSVGYSSCHWCHVMEKEVFENEVIANYLNKFFINIKVDREERPDLDAVFMQSVQMLTGKGGWPMSVFLTSDLKPFYGGTYFPAQQFSQLISHINGVYREKRDIVEKQSDDLYERISGTLPISESSTLSKDEIDEIVQTALQNVDQKHGGFVDAMKFPTPLRWQFLLHYYRLTGDEELGNSIRLTLDKMGAGGINDHIGGGFHRYTVDHIWLIPHFEKMLYDNAQLASLYLEAYAVYKDKRYGQIATDTLDFLIRDMFEEGAGFYGSYDADSGGHEGTYYTWKQSEVEEVVGSEDAKALFRLLGVKEVPNFEGSNVLSRNLSVEQVAKELDLDIEYVSGLIQKHREALRIERDKRVKPGLDKKIITSWNGLAISALSQGYRQFNDNRYLKAAKSAADFLINKHKKEDSSYYRTSTAGVVKGDAILDDYSFLANAFLDLFQACGEILYLKEALSILDFVKSNLHNPEGGYYLTPESTETPLGRQIDFYDAVEPSGNSALLMAFLKASALTGDSKWRDEVKRVLGYYTDIIKRAGTDMGKWLDVANFLNNSFHEVIIAGDLKTGNGADLYEALNSLAPSFSVFVNAPESNNPELEKLIPSIKDKTIVNEKATVYVCEYGTCQAPTNDVNEFEKQVMSGWSY